MAYKTDLAQAKATMKRMADSVWKDEKPGRSVLEESEVCGVVAFGLDGVAIRLVMKIWPADQWNVMRELRQRMKESPTPRASRSPSRSAPCGSVAIPHRPVLRSGMT